MSHPLIFLWNGIATFFLSKFYYQIINLACSKKKIPFNGIWFWVPIFFFKTQLWLGFKYNIKMLRIILHTHQETCHINSMSSKTWSMTNNIWCLIVNLVTGNEIKVEEVPIITGQSFPLLINWKEKKTNGEKWLMDKTKKYQSIKSSLIFVLWPLSL